MYIHNYQIHNVLNAYRKQLSQNPTKGSEKQSSNGGSAPKEMVTLSGKGQQPSIVNKISAEIIDRITQFDPETEFNQAMTRQLTESASQRSTDSNDSGGEFTYTMIDDQNQKSTHKLTTQALVSPDSTTVSQNQSASKTDPSMKLTGNELLNDNQVIQPHEKG